MALLLSKRFQAFFGILQRAKHFTRTSTFSVLGTGRRYLHNIVMQQERASCSSFLRRTCISSAWVSLYFKGLPSSSPIFLNFITSSTSVEPGRGSALIVCPNKFQFPNPEITQIELQIWQSPANTGLHWPITLSIRMPSIPYCTKTANTLSTSPSLKKDARILSHGTWLSGTRRKTTSSYGGAFTIRWKFLDHIVLDHTRGHGGFGNFRCKDLKPRNHVRTCACEL